MSDAWSLTPFARHGWFMIMQALFPGRETLEALARWTPGWVIVWRFRRLLKAVYRYTLCPVDCQLGRRLPASGLSPHSAKKPPGVPTRKCPVSRDGGLLCSARLGQADHRGGRCLPTASGIQRQSGETGRGRLCNCRGPTPWIMWSVWLAAPRPVELCDHA